MSSLDKAILVGGVVRLKSGSPKMVVEEVVMDNGQTLAVCSWVSYATGQPYSLPYNVNVLVKEVSNGTSY